MNETLPIADPSYVEMAERLFGEYRNMTPEEWAARNAHTIGCSSFDQYQYTYLELHNWIHRLHEILRTPGAVTNLRKQYLTEAEIKYIEENDPF